MKFNTDSHFVIGRYHIRQNKPCQDHALDRIKDNGDAAVVCVSDGCSSGGHTDIGSRVITLSTIRAVMDRNLRIPINTDIQPGFIADAINTYSLVSRTALSITNEDMLATSIYAVLNEHGGYIHMLGDGACAIKYKDGTIAVAVVDWEQNTPYYPIYRENLQEFIDVHMRFNNGERSAKITSIITSEVTPSIKYLPVEKAVQGHIIRLYEDEMKDIECIGIFSDGVTDFQDERKNDRLPVKMVIDEMMSFKNYTGEFVKRRVSAALKTLAREDIHPNDDFSMAVIHINHDSIETDGNSNT